MMAIKQFYIVIVYKSVMQECKGFWIDFSQSTTFCMVES